jgi:lambda family phage tail tape measure protein
MSEVIGRSAIEVSADTTQLVAGIETAKKSIKGLGTAAAQAGREASGGVDGIGKGVEQVGQRFDAATKNIIGSIQRTTAAMEAGSRTNSKYFETLASQRGINTDALKPYLEQLDAVRIKQQALSAPVNVSGQAGAAFLEKLRDQVATASLGEAALLRYRAAQAGVSAEASGLVLQLQNVKAAMAAKAAEDTRAATAAREQAAAARSQAAAQQAFMASLREQVATKGLDATGLLQYRAAQLGVSREADTLIAQLRRTDPALAGVGMSARATAAALRGVPAQVTDIVTSLQAGQSPITVLLQQGGQLKDIFGGVGPAARALGGYVAGLVTPFTVAAGAVAALTYAFFRGSEEAQEYAKAIILSGNAAGQTIGNLQKMAQSIAGVTFTQGEAASALAQFAANGNIASASMERFAVLALRMEQTTGTAVSKTVDQFAELAKDPVAASIKLNETTRFLTTTIYQQIKALEEQGRTADAAAVAQNALASMMEQGLDKLDGRLGYIQQRWRELGIAARQAWDQMLNVGRPSNPQDQIGELQRQLEARIQRGPLNPSISDSAFEKGNQALRERIANLQHGVNAENQNAEAQKKAADQTRARIAFDKEGDQFLPNRVKMEREIAKAREQGKNAGASQKEIDERVANIREKLTPKGAASKQRLIDRSELNLELEEIKKAAEALTNTYGNAEKILETQRSAGLVGEREYYEAKRAFLRLNAQAQEDAATKEIARLQAENLKGKDKIDNDRKIVKAQAELTKVRESSVAALEILGVQEQAAAKRLAQSYRDAEDAAQEYLDALRKAQQEELSAFGVGNQERDRIRGRAQIEDRFSDKRRELEKSRRDAEFAGTFGADAQKKYDDELDRIRRFQAQALTSYDEYYGARIRKEQDASVGVNEALKNYFDDAQNLAKHAEDVVSNAFQGMEDALVKFVTTGKLDFKSLADSIAADIARIIIKQKLAELVGKDGSGLLGGLAKLFTGGNSASATADAGNAAQATFRASEILAQNAATASAAASTAALAAAESAASAAISAASTTSAAALSALTSAATAAATALSTISASATMNGGGSLLGGLFGGGGGFGTGSAYGNMDFGGFLAEGGTVVPGKSYIVGERGPELFLPTGSGHIIPNSEMRQASAGGGATYINNISVAMPVGASRETGMQFGANVARQLQHAGRRQGVKS